jgi:hypothetical protein
MPRPPLKTYSFATSEAMDDTDRQKLLSAAFHDVEIIVGGHVMRPLDLASYDVLLRTGNPLVMGQEPQDGTPEYTSAVIGFVYAHCAPWPDVVRASFNEQMFRESALIFCGGITPSDFKIALEQVIAQARELEAAQVQTMGEIGGKKPLPATNPAS